MPNVFIVNNAIDAANLNQAELIWKIVSEDRILSSGTAQTPPVKHDDRANFVLPINLPSQLPQDKSYCQLQIEYHVKGEIISKNEYDLLLAEKTWLQIDKIPRDKKIAVFDITGETTKVLDDLGIQYETYKDLTQMRTQKSDLIIIANLDADNEVPYNWEDTKKICGNGTNVLLIHPGKHLQWLYYDKIESIYERKGRIVNMHMPEHHAFNGIEPMELSWWQQINRESPRACKRSYRLKNTNNSQALATYLRPHTGLGNPRDSYLKEMSGIPLLQIQETNARLISSEMETNQADKDPIAAKLLVNLIIDLLNN